MLGIIGLLGALVAGVVGDALMAMAHKDQDDDDAPTADADLMPTDQGDMLVDDDAVPNTATHDMVFPEAGDGGQDGLRTDPAEMAPLLQADLPDEFLRGTDVDEFILGTPAADLIEGAGGNDTTDGGADADTLFGGLGDDSLTGTDDDAADHLHGGDGADGLHLGAGDTGWGNAGDDDFTLSDYAPGDPPAVIADYTPGEDRIVLIYDANLHPEPIVHTESIEGTEDISVLLDGIQIAIVQGAAGLDWEDIQLMAA